MPTNLAIDDRLIKEAQKLGHHRTKRETVTAALDEYIQRRKQQTLLGLFGSIEYDGEYDYRRERRRKAPLAPPPCPQCLLAFRRTAHAHASDYSIRVLEKVPLRGSAATVLGI